MCPEVTGSRWCRAQSKREGLENIFGQRNERKHAEYLLTGLFTLLSSRLQSKQSSALQDPRVHCKTLDILSSSWVSLGMSTTRPQVNSTCPVENACVEKGLLFFLTMFSLLLGVPATPNRLWPSLLLCFLHSRRPSHYSAPPPPRKTLAQQWWHTPLIPALGRQRQVDLWVWYQPGLQSEFQDSQSYTEKPCLEPPPPKKKERH
jgi:hypothetical protein